MLTNVFLSVTFSTWAKILIFTFLKKQLKRKIESFGVIVDDNVVENKFILRTIWSFERCVYLWFMCVKWPNTYGWTVIFFVNALISNKRKSRSNRVTVYLFFFFFFIIIIYLFIFIIFYWSIYYYLLAIMLHWFM